MVERGGLENRCALAGTVGSNPTPSAIISYELVFHCIADNEKTVICEELYRGDC